MNSYSNNNYNNNEKYIIILKNYYILDKNKMGDIIDPTTTINPTTTIDATTTINPTTTIDPTTTTTEPSINDIVSDFKTKLMDALPDGMMDMLNGLTMGPQYAEQRDLYLGIELYNKQKQLEDLPKEIGRAEKNYYEYNKGEPGGENNYSNLIFDRYARTAKEFRTNSIEKQQDFANNLSRALKQYQGQLVFFKQSNNLLNTRNKKQKDLIKKINKLQAILQTSQRKVEYENQNSESLFLYRRIMLFIYYSAIIGYILLGNFIPDELYKNYTVWIIIFIAIIMPLLLNLTVKWMFVMYDAISYWFADLPTKDVYADL